MKKRIYINLIILFAVLFTIPSCMDLDEVVDDSIPADNIGKTEAEVYAIVGPVYKTLCRYFTSNFMTLHDDTGDMSIVATKRGGDYFDGGQYREIHMHTWTATNASIRGAWNRATQALSTCNLVLNIIENNDMLEADFKARTLAEIRGVRAFWLYVMMDNWGNIPLVTSYTDTNLPGITPRKEVYEFIMEELHAIKDVVRSDVTDASYGKFTRGAAYTLLAKMYLNAEAWGVDGPRWKEAADACDEVMKLNYIIEPNWKTNFQVNNESSREAIFAICYSINDKDIYRNNLYSQLHYKDNIALGFKGSGSNRIAAQPDYVRLFDEEDQRYEGSFLLGPMIDPATGEVLMTAHDRPLIHTIDITIIPGTERDGTVWGDVNQEDGARCNKWVYDKGITNAMDNDFHIFRLADVYLMKAEALVRQGMDNGEATRLVNIIRSRGYGNDEHNYSSVTLKEIALERKLELAWEQINRQDCIRFGTFQDARFLKPATHGKDYLNIFPIPQTAWQANDRLVQNPGYPPF